MRDHALRRKRNWREPPSAIVQLTVVASAGLAAGLAFAEAYSASLAPLVGWDVSALVYLIWVWRVIWPMDSVETARLAVREDPNRPVRDLLLLTACLVSLVAIVFVLVTAHALTGPAEQVHVGLGTGSVLLSWGVVHTVFTTLYARVYYSGFDAGIDFKESSPPRYSDFAYVAFTVGMTFQVSDTDLTRNQMRTAVLKHALLSYLFGAVIIAATINLLAGLVR